MSQLSHIFSLSLRDYSHEWRMSGCFVLALASVLAPMMILFGLKFGIVSSMINELVENPKNRELRAVGSGRYTEDWFDRLSQHADVAFVIPKTRALAATLQLQSRSSNSIQSAEILATASGDPLFPVQQSEPQGYFEVVLSQSLARKLNVKSGDRIDASLARQAQGKRQREHLPVRVIGVVPGEGSRNLAYVSLDLLLAAEQYKDGREVLALGWDGNPDALQQRFYPSFRLYAKSIYDVENLVDLMADEGIEVKANVSEISSVRSIDYNLSIIFWIIALVGAAGFSFSLGASLWANVDRKRKDLSVMRLIGFNSVNIILFPLFQSLFTAVLGWLLAVLMYLAAEHSINHLLAPQLQIQQALCFLEPEHFLWALALTLVTALLAALLGGFRAARIEPSDGLRDV